LWHCREDVEGDRGSDEISEGKGGGGLGKPLPGVRWRGFTARNGGKGKNAGPGEDEGGVFQVSAVGVAGSERNLVGKGPDTGGISGSAHKRMLAKKRGRGRPKVGGPEKETTHFFRDPGGPGGGKNRGGEVGRECLGGKGLLGGVWYNPEK